jgi:hypothetical protein
MQINRRKILSWLSASIAVTTARAQNPQSKVAIEFTEAKFGRARQWFRLETRSNKLNSEFRVLIVYERQGWKPGVTRSKSYEEPILALAKKSNINGGSTYGGAQQWEISIDEERLPNEFYAVACQSSNINSTRNIERELHDLQRVLELINRPSYSQREKSFEDVLRALFEFDWVPLGYTKIAVPGGSV